MKHRVGATRKRTLEGFFVFGPTARRQRDMAILRHPTLPAARETSHRREEQRYRSPLASRSQGFARQAVSARHSYRAAGCTTAVLDRPEDRQALSVLLEGVAGYILSRRPEALAGTSSFEQILIVPTSSPIAESTGGTPQPRVGVRLPPPPFVRARAMRPEQPDAGSGDRSHDDPTIPVWMPEFARSSGGGARIVPPWVPDPNPSQPVSQTEADPR